MQALLFQISNYCLFWIERFALDHTIPLALLFSFVKSFSNPAATWPVLKPSSPLILLIEYQRPDQRVLLTAMQICMYCYRLTFCKPEGWRLLNREPTLPSNSPSRAKQRTCNACPSSNCILRAHKTAPPLTSERAELLIARLGSNSGFHATTYPVCLAREREELGLACVAICVLNGSAFRALSVARNCFRYHSAGIH